VTLRAALEERYNGEALRRLAQALGVAGPGRKADLAAGIAATILGRDASSSRLDDPVSANDDLPLTVVDTEQAATQELFAVLQLVDMDTIQVSAQTRRHAWKKWIGTSIFDEFSRVDAIKGQSDRKRLTAVAGRRHAVAGALAECPVGSWIAISEFSRHMRATGNTFEVAHDPWKLLIAEKCNTAVSDTRAATAGECCKSAT